MTLLQGKPLRPPSPAKQVKINLGATGLSATEVKKVVAAYIVENMLPISTVESLWSITKKTKLTKSDVKLLQRKSFEGYIEIIDVNLKALLGDIDSNTPVFPPPLTSGW